VRQGRHIFTNIQAAFLYILAFHIPVVALAFLAPAFGLPMLLLPVHLVWLELIIHPVSAVVFQAEPAPADLMLRPPRSPAAPLLPRAAMVRSALAGAVLTLAVLWLYWSRQAVGELAARSVAWATLLLGYQVLVFVEWAALRGRRSALLPQRPLVWIVWLLCGVSLPVAMTVPPLAGALHLQAISPAQWALALGVALGATAWRAVLDHVRPVSASAPASGSTSAPS
jgi:Ca2+-transporting ATPase